MRNLVASIAAVVILCTPITQCCCFVIIRDINQFRLQSKVVSEEVDSASSSPSHPPNFSATSTFNHDIARTLFPPLFFTLYHKYSNQNQQHDHETIRQHLKRPSPFEDPSSAQTAERMLRRMMENRFRSDGRTVCPDYRTFNLVAGSYGRLRCQNDIAKQGRTSTLKSSDRIISVSWDEEPKRSPQYRTTINNNNDEIFTSQLVTMTPVDKLEELLQLQLRLCHYESWPVEILPSVNMFNRILKRLAWRSGNIEHNSSQQSRDAEQALHWLEFMNSTLPLQTTMGSRTSTVCPFNADSISFVVEALANHRSQTYAETENTTHYVSVPNMATELGFHSEFTSLLQNPHCFLQKAEELLAIQEDMYNLDKSYKSKRALAHSYKCLCEGYGRYAVTSSSDSSEKNHAIKRAHELLHSLEELTSAPSSSYVSVILALSISERSSSAAAAEEFLNRMLEKCQQPDVNDISKAFSGCIAAYVKNKDAPNAEKVLFQMIELYESGELGNFVPEPRAFGTCIAAWSKYDPNGRGTKWVSSQQQRKYNADRAESILVELERVARNEASKNNSNFVLHATPYNIAILARVQTLDASTPKARKSNEDIMFHAQSILDHMEFEMGVPGDPFTYSILLNGWAKQSSPINEKAADCAEQLLRRRIEDVDIAKIYNDDDYYLSQTKIDDVWPNVKHYSSVLKAHADCKTPAGAKKALSLLSEMEKRFYEAKVINDAAEVDAEFHMDQKDAAKPDLVCYSIVIDAFAKQKQLAEASNVAYRLLRSIEQKYEAGDLSMKPNTRIYTAVILSLVNSPYNGEEDDREKIINAQRAWSILDEMKANDVQPNSFTYNYIINCCAQESSHDENDKRISFEIAVKSFQELRKMAASSSKSTPNDPEESCSSDNYHPDSFTYAFMLKACNNLLPPSQFRTKVATQIFKECCKCGYCSQEVIKRLRWCVDSEEFHSLIGIDRFRTDDVEMDDLPSSWRRCCRQNTRRRNNASS